ncbi:MAG TPA: 8-oxo-dGTP diphosphatase [Trueperaceae bacterium]|nr:8-oxo-dGTP diphosphatase [Trueperaceae bacterium]
MGLKLCTLAYVRDGDKTLMLRRPADGAHPQAGKYNGLGGKFEAGESPETCLAREVLEESGLTVEEARLKGFITFPDFDGDDDWYVFVYLVTAFSGTLAPSDEGELHWIETAAVPALPLWEGDRYFLPWLDRPGLFSAVFRYLGGRYAGHEVVFYPGDGPARID